MRLDATYEEGRSSVCFVKYFSDIEFYTGTYIKSYYSNGVFGSNDYSIF